MDHVGPNHSPFPSMAQNSPQMAPFLRPDGFGPVMLSEVSETTALGDSVTGQPATPLGAENALMALRHKFPYLPILPFTNTIETVALVQNTPTELRIPQSTAVALFIGQGNYFVSTQGNAAIPVAGQPGTRSIYKPEGYLFYLRGCNSISLISPDAACVVTMMGFIPTEYPTA